MGTMFRDVNREEYMKALLLDAQKQAKLNALPERAQTVYSYIVNNPTNTNVKFDKFGIVVKDGMAIIKATAKKRK